MRKSKFSEDLITMALRQGEPGTPVAQICRKLGISQATFFRWKRTYDSLGVPELRELRQLRQEKRRLKHLVADLSLDKSILQESLRKKMVRPTDQRRVAEWARTAFQVSERRACSAVGVARSTVRGGVRWHAELVRSQQALTSAGRWTSCTTLWPRVGGCGSSPSSTCTPGSAWRSFQRRSLPGWTSSITSSSADLLLRPNARQQGQQIFMCHGHSCR